MLDQRQHRAARRISRRLVTRQSEQEAKSENLDILEGLAIDPRGDKPGNRTIYFDNNLHPVAIEFVNGKAVRITPEN